MLAEKLRRLTAAGFEVRFSEVTGFDAHGEGVPREPYMTMDLTIARTRETVGADFFEEDPSDGDLETELDGLVELLNAKTKLAGQLATVASHGGRDAS